MLKAIRLIYLILIAAPLFLISTLLAAVTTIVMTAFGDKFWGYWPAHIWSKFVCLIFWVKVEVRGRENVKKNQSYIFVCNHQGAFDIWAIYGFLNHNFKWMMKKSLEKIVFVGFACKRAGHIFVDSNSLQSIRETIDKSRSQLREGMSMVIFPEGTRSQNGEMGDFKRGAFMLAGEFMLPVVPLSINGAYRVMPKDSYIPRPGKIILTIHPPIYPGERGFNTRQLMAQCHETIQADLKTPSNKNGEK